MAKNDDDVLAELGLDDSKPAKNDALGKVFESFEGENEASETWIDRVQPPAKPHWVRGCLPAGCAAAVLAFAGFVALVWVVNIGRVPEPSLDERLQMIVAAANADYRPASGQKCFESFKIDGQTLVLTVGDGLPELNPIKQKMLLQDMAKAWGIVNYRGTVRLRTWDGVILAELDAIEPEIE